mmetsp:Transcript_24674/g.38379  ORF Transcript_24674/g.38379 Transcript_24674/m.38379 type:complete len:222 (+) Transcript_24674:59-724(+)
MFATMSDAELQKYIDSVKGFNPMMANVTPQQLRQMTSRFDGMSDSDMDRAKNMAGPEMRRMQEQMGAGQQPPPAAAPPTSDLPPMAKNDLEKATALKGEAAKVFKEKQFDKATEKYYEILNIIRENDTLKQSPEGKELETTSRLNIALCRLNSKDYDIAIDQCERVLDKNPQNWKASFRLASAMKQKMESLPNLSEEQKQKSLESILRHSKTAMDNNSKEA